MRILLLCVFGAVGTLSRYGLQGLVQDKTGSGFPSGTLVVNLTGCFVLGLLGEYALNHVSIPPDWRVAITTGFVGAYTTFSTFEWETAHMIQDGEWTKAAIYVGVSVIVGVLAALTGMRLGDALS
ncbi:MAG TPA: fluoride efflux transporter CrcB [Terriglobia bacterium]|nr:fluoride efflux transporter CrcB [Terriglobia bacterium]